MGRVVQPLCHRCPLSRECAWRSQTSVGPDGPGRVARCQARREGRRLPTCSGSPSPSRTAQSARPARSWRRAQDRGRSRSLARRGASCSVTEGASTRGSPSSVAPSGSRSVPATGTARPTSARPWASTLVLSGRSDAGLEQLRACRRRRHGPDDPGPDPDAPGDHALLLPRAPARGGGRPGGGPAAPAVGRRPGLGGAHPERARSRLPGPGTDSRRRPAPSERPTSSSSARGRTSRR